MRGVRDVERGRSSLRRRAAVDQRGMMTSRAAAPATDERSGQGRGDPRPAPPAVGAGAPTRQGEGAVQPGRPGVPGGAGAPAAAGRAAQAAAAGPAGHGATLAPRPGRPPPRRRVQAEAPGSTPHRAFHPCPGAAPGTGRSHVGLPAPPRRAAGAGREGGPLHGLGDPAGGRDRSVTPTELRYVGGLPALAGQRPAGVRFLRDGHLVRGTDVRARSDRARQSADPDSGRPRHTRPPPGWRSPRRISSWTWRTHAAGRGS